MTRLPRSLAVQGGSPVVIDLYLDGTVLRLAAEHRYRAGRRGALARRSALLDRTADQREHLQFRYRRRHGAHHPEPGHDSDISQSHAVADGAPNFQGAIGATADGVEGTDIVVPVYQFSETHYLPATFVTPAYKATVFWLTGKVSSQSLQGIQRR
jgi:hypothetical protein